MISWDIIGMRTMQGRFGSVVESLQGDVIEEGEEVMRRVQDTYRRFAPVGVSTLHFRDSIKADLMPTPYGFDANVEALTPLREYIKHGTKPHMPPVDEIAPWAEAHGIEPWALAMSIKMKGTAANDWEERAKPWAEIEVRTFGNRVGNRVMTRLR